MTLTLLCKSNVKLSESAQNTAKSLFFAHQVSVIFQRQK
ncbi:hypothetical protein JCM19233_7057 [Vibrio astriarenae]|nr:hypothetical protein JCM19233_7057 [Vibrio sp. C7]